MSSSHHGPVDQPKTFKFSDASMKRVEKEIAKYPKGRQASAVMALLTIAQEQHDNWIPEAAMEEIAHILDMPRIKVFEVATFYTMYHLAPKGRHLLQVCTTTPCWLRGSADIVKACEDHLGIKLGGVTPDGEFGLVDVECLGACVNAPVVQHNGDDLYEDLTPATIVMAIEDIKAGKKPKHGSHAGRITSMGPAGATCLTEIADKCGVKKA